jgi:hypothetical protein
MTHRGLSKEVEVRATADRKKALAARPAMARLLLGARASGPPLRARRPAHPGKKPQGSSRSKLIFDILASSLRGTGMRSFWVEHGDAVVVGVVISLFTVFLGPTLRDFAKDAGQKLTDWIGAISRGLHFGGCPLCGSQQGL